MTHLLTTPPCLRGPDYRWQLAQRLLEDGEPIPLPRLDAPTRRVIGYLQRVHGGANGRAEAARHDPDLAAAEHLWEAPAAAKELRILAIAGCPRAEIAARLGVAEPVIAAAEELFFDVRARRTAPGWVVQQVIAREVERGDADLAVRLRAAFCGGPAVARALLDGQLALPADRAEQLCQQDRLLGLKLEAALEMPVGATLQPELVQVILEYFLNREWLELEKRKFAEQCLRGAQGGAEGLPAEAGGVTSEGDPAAPPWSWRWPRPENPASDGAPPAARPVAEDAV